MILDEFTLKGDVAILTGCGHCWLGLLATALSEAGATVILAAGKDQIDSAKEQMPGQWADRLIEIPCDKITGAKTEEVAKDVLSQYGSLDILVNNPNLEFAKPFLSMNETEITQVMDDNFTSSVHWCKAAGKVMIPRQSGRIVNIVSAAAERGLANGSIYCASMGGVLQLTRALSLEWARQNVRINAVGLGWMENAFGGDQENRIARYVPMRRRGKPEDIAPLVLFLASKASSYLNGHIFFADGGLMARA